MHSNFANKNKKMYKQNKKNIHFLITFLENFKQALLLRLFWGRHNLYKNIIHIFVILITLFFSVSGFINKFYVTEAKSELSGELMFSFADLVQQGLSIETVNKREKDLSNVEVLVHTVIPGEDLLSIAEKYGRKVETIRWMNRDVVSPFGNILQVGSKIKIPINVDGVMYIVKQGQTIYDIIKETGSNEFDVVEFNNLRPPYNLFAGQQLFIPDGTLYNPEINIAGIPRGIFSNPVGHPECSGYVVTRGFLSYHNGVDLAKWPGCPIRAIAAGNVIYAGWAPAMGYNVQIDHGGGIVSHYYHAREVYVQRGQRVQQNDIIMYMGTTGNSTGVHLHLSLFKDGVAVDPAPFVPY